ncbi:Endoplasmic reticulum export factor CTAGE5 [Merluccius polli]|uniref:Endoplasmic reticulum export factor CTAGE5 n=1 Tax=Merluccius polli TaxID=89951 RepID=A0AA47P5V8_MERPO|nr:Endoplasmic reticulum export factor CTAGE5 [Merluccius polli]
MVPFQTVERRGFKAMIRAIDPRYEVPSRKYVTETEMPKLYAKLREKVEKELCDLKYFATTTDLWSSRTMEPFLSLTIHYITDDWNLGSRCFSEHTAEEIAQGLKEALESWGFKEERQVCITTDNGSNVVKAASLNDWTRLQCFGHRLHLAIEKSVKDPRINRAVALCKKIVSSFSHSWKRRKALKKAQAEHNLPLHRLITETPTRWGSRQMMIQRVLGQEKALSQVLKADRKTRHLVPTWQDTDVLESISKTLGPLLEFTAALSGEQYVSVSYIKPVLQLFNNTVLAPADDDTELTKDMKRVILEYLNEKYSDPETVDLLDMASLVDPRFKDAYIADDRKDFMKTRAVAEIQSLLEVQAATVTEPHTSTEVAADGAAAAEVAVESQSKRVKRSLGSFFKKASDGTAALADRKAIEVEIKSYLQTMQKYLCIPATSAPSERAFSYGGNIVTCHWSLLKPETVDKLVFLIVELEESIKTSEEESKELQSQEEEAVTTLKIYNMNSERLQRNLESAKEENILLQESNTQLSEQMEGWVERVSELEEEMRRCEAAHSMMQQDVDTKDHRIKYLTDRLLGMKAWESDLEHEEEGERDASNGDENERHLQKVQKLIYAAKLNADLKSMDEDKDRMFAKLNDEIQAKEELKQGIKGLENERSSLQTQAEHYTEQVQRLQQKLLIMTEMYQENELKLHRLLTVEEKERLQKEEKLNKADKNISLAMEELDNYRQQAENMEEELEKTKQSYQTQISAHEKKAHNNWLAARSAERDLADIRRENALLRQKLTDTQFKLDTIDKDPYALDSLARPLPFRGERSPYGPSPLGRPSSETRPFLSPPTLMEGPCSRLSPRVPRAPPEPLAGGREMERSGGPHSDGSNSPTWERDRRGPPAPLGSLGPPGVCV